jgi:hypothetical protein
MPKIHFSTLKTINKIMIDFRKLVLEAPQPANEPNPAAAPSAGVAPTPSTPTDTKQEATKEDQQAKDVTQFFDTNHYNELKTAFETKYKNLELKFPTEDEFKNIVYTAANNSIRNTKDPTAFANVALVYPLLDLIAQVKTSLKNKQNAEPAYKGFLKRLNGSQGTPLDYVPVDPWALSVKQEYFTRDKAELGELALNKHTDKSILDTILALLSARRKQVVKKLTFKKDVSKNVDPNKIPNALNFVKDLIYYPERYAGGNVPIPPKLTGLYDIDSARELLTIGRLAKAFFQGEAGKIQPPLEQSKFQEAYEAFLNNNPLKDENFDWTPYQQQKNQEDQSQEEEQTTNTESFNLLYDQLYALLSEKNAKQRRKARRQREREQQTNTDNNPPADQDQQTTNNEDKPQKGDKVNYGPGYEFEFDGTDWTHEGTKVSKPGDAEKLNNKWKEQKTPNPLPPSSEQDSSEESSEEKEQSTTEEEPKQEKQTPQENAAQIEKGGYTLNNVKQLGEQRNTQAKALYDALKKFADYIRAGIERDYTGAIQSAAGAMKSLSKIGGPTMGK